jgi:rhodanese-related sulfurtransferase
MFNFLSKNKVKEIEVHELKHKMSTKSKIHIIDVRGHDERKSSTSIQESICVPQDVLPFHLHHIPNDNSEVIMVCKSGKRSSAAAALLQKEGFRNVQNLKGGMMAWDADQA